MKIQSSGDPRDADGRTSGGTDRASGRPADAGAGARGGAGRGLATGWRRWLDGSAAHPFTMAIFQTGVGTRALFEAAEGLGSTACARAHARATQSWWCAARSRLASSDSRGVRIDLRADRAVHDRYACSRRCPACRWSMAASWSSDTGRRIESSATRSSRAERAWRKSRLIDGICPPDVAPLMRLIDVLAASKVDAVVFTSAVQVRNLFAIAERMNRGADLARLLGRGGRRLHWPGLYRGLGGAWREAHVRGQPAEAWRADAGSGVSAGLSSFLHGYVCRRSSDGMPLRSLTADSSRLRQWNPKASGIKPLPLRQISCRSTTR